jgi:hypothetical protein
MMLALKGHFRRLLVFRHTLRSVLDWREKLRKNIEIFKKDENGCFFPIFFV